MDINSKLQFVWWAGVVENRQDPKKAGRCQVRIVGDHSENKSELPTAGLPWAQPLMPVNDGASMQIKEGDYVVGFYFDGTDCQVPIIVGILPGIPERLQSTSTGFSDPRTGAQLSSAPKRPRSLVFGVGKVTIIEGTASRNPSRLNESTLPRLARNEKISETPIQSKKSSAATGIPVAGGKTWSEKKTPYAAQYPYNRAMETESGHILEFDDTPGAERIHIYHRSGTFVEYHPDGSMVRRINADAYEVILGDNNIYVNGDVNITASKSINLKAGLNVNIEAGGNIVLNALGAISSQAVVGQAHATTGPMSLNGIPMNLNGPPVVVLPPPIPVVVVIP